MAKVTREHSSRQLADGEKLIGRVNPDRMLQLTLHVKPAGDMLATEAHQRARDPLRAGPHLTRAQFAATHGAKITDMRRVRQFARQYGLHIVPDALAHDLGTTSLAQRAVEVRARAADVNRALGIDLVRVRGRDGSMYRTHLGPYNVPAEFDDLIGNVFGLDNRPQVSAHSRPSPHLGGTQPEGVSYTPPEIAKAYGFPTNVTGKGQTIAILEMGGGYRRRDLRRYFKSLGLQVPQVQWVSVAGGQNAPTGDPNGPDSEVLLDIEVAGAVANGANYVVYFAPNTNRGFFKAVNAVVNDATNQPTVFSISWGGPEGSWSNQDMQSISSALQAAAVMGMSVYVAAGDNGSTDGVRGRRPNVDFPASSPWSTACGGTSLYAGPSGKLETVWNDGDGGGTGGGISAVFPVPDYQSATIYQSQPLPMRGLPDVAGCADPNTGYQVRIDGADTVYGGTSAVAPLWAALTALLNESTGQSLGFINPLLYMTTLKGALSDITVGDNDTTGRVGKYAAGAGRDPCTGFGSPTPQILALLSSP